MDLDISMEDVVWTNVQLPVQHMFLSLTKALRVQAAAIKELDSKCKSFATKEQLQQSVGSITENTCSKHDATQIIYQLESKVSERDYNSTQAKLFKVSFST